MQTILLSKQDSEQRHAQMSVGSHVGNLFVGLLLGLFLLLLDRRNQKLIPSSPKQPRSWRSIFFTCLWIALTFFLLINLIMGP